MWIPQNNVITLLQLWICCSSDSNPTLSPLPAGSLWWFRVENVGRGHQVEGTRGLLLPVCFLCILAEAVNHSNVSIHRKSVLLSPQRQWQQPAPLKAQRTGSQLCRNSLLVRNLYHQLRRITYSGFVFHVGCSSKLLSFNYSTSSLCASNSREW